jgi:hypothetical protein
VDLWRPVPFGDAWDVNNAPILNVFRGFDVDLAVYGQAVLHRLSYNLPSRKGSFRKSVPGSGKAYDLESLVSEGPRGDCLATIG